MAVPAKRVRVLSDEVAAMLGNRRSFGMWTTAPARIGGFAYRVVNNTQGCFASKLVVFEQDPPASVSWPAVGPDLCDAEGMVRMCVSKGTAVPISLVRSPNRAKRPPPETEPEPEPETEPETELETELEPELGIAMPDWFVPGVETLETLETLGPLLPFSSECVPELDSEVDPVVEVADVVLAEVVAPSVLMKLHGVDQNLVRKQRNRESAATSRERKRKYISHLEDQVDALEHRVHALQQENAFWKSLGLGA